MCGRGQPRWRLLPLEMLFMCTCYSRLHWRWFGHVSPSYCTTWPSLVLDHFRFLLDHMSGPCYSTCQFSIGTRVMLWLGHVSFVHWTMCRIFIGPRGHFLFDHVSWCYPSMFHFLIRPRGLMTSFYVSDFISPRVMPWLFHGSCTGSSMCHIFYLITWPAQVLPHAQQSNHHKSNSRSSLLHRLTT